MSALLTKLNFLGVPIGSRVYGVAKEYSDYDFIIHESKIPKEILSNITYRSCNQTDICTEIIIAEHYQLEIWGQDLIDITRCIDLEGNSINLFIYPDNSKEIYSLFKELNTKMKSQSRTMLLHKPTRIDLFIRYCRELGIAYEKE